MVDQRLLHSFGALMGSSLAGAGGLETALADGFGKSELVLGVDRDADWGDTNSWSLDSSWAGVLSLNSFTLARAVLFNGVELLGGVLGPVVVVVLVVDVVDVVVVDVGSLQGLVALKVSLSTPEDVALTLWVDQDWGSSASEVVVLSSKAEGVWGVRVSWGNISSSDVSSWDHGKSLLDSLNSSWDSLWDHGWSEVDHISCGCSEYDVLSLGSEGIEVGESLSLLSCCFNSCSSSHGLSKAAFLTEKNVLSLSSSEGLEVGEASEIAIL